MTSRFRIYIDCAFIDFAKQPTGIPRVVLKYIEVGYAWGQRNNIEVVPVVATAENLVICRPVPGMGAPESLLDKVRESEVGSAQDKARSIARQILRYLKNIAHHSLFFLASVLPIPPVKSTAVWIDDAFERGCHRFEVSSENISVIKYLPRKGDVLFSPAYWHDVDPTIYESLRNKGISIVILVHDVLPIAYENFYPSPWRYLFKDNVRRAFRYASAFFCVSELTKAMLLEFSERQKTPAVPLITAYNGFEPLVSEAAQEQIETATSKPLLGNAHFYTIVDLHPLIMVGSVEPKKGHVPVIKCLEAMWSAGFERPLLIIGRTGWMERDVVATIEGSFFYGKKLFWFSNIDDFDLAVAYLSCRALIFSSLAEGFGIPMIEASYYGKPTIALDTLIVREILGERALIFNSAAGFVQHVVNLEDDTSYAAACAAAESLRWPSWDDYTPAVFDALANLSEEKVELPSQIVPSSSRALTVVPATPSVAA